jgi:hypothetical protein
MNHTQTHGASLRPRASATGARTSRRAALAFGTLTLAACAGDHADVTAPPPTTPTEAVARGACGGGSPLQLGVLQGITLDCATATSVQLAPGSATYLVVPQFATDAAALQPVSYSLAASGNVSQAATDVRAATAIPGVEPSTPARPAPGARQRAFDAGLRAAERSALARGEWRRDAGDPRARADRVPQRAQVVAPPELNSVRDFRVLASLASSRPTYATVSARLAYVGANVLVYVDTLAPARGFSADQLTAFGRLFDQTLYPLDVDTFGAPSDLDGNRRLVMLLTPVVNALVTRAECRTGGYVAGFFDGIDLASAGANSNHGEIFYGVVPDPAGAVSCAHSVAELTGTLPATFLHELQHLISFSQHVVLHGGNPEDGWLDEGMSLVAEELGSLYFERHFPPPSGRASPTQLFPDSAQGFIAGDLSSSYAYLLRPDSASTTLHSDADDGLAWRGGDWLLLRWLGDHEAPGFYKQLEQSTRTGAANIAAAAGEPFAALFADFGVSLYTDSVPGVAKAAVPARYRFQSRTLRALYDRLYASDGPSADVPRPFPIAAASLRGSVTASMVPGTTSYYLLTTAAGGAVTLRFATPAGTPLGTALHPQLSIVRLP